MAGDSSPGISGNEQAATIEKKLKQSTLPGGNILLQSNQPGHSDEKTHDHAPGKQTLNGIMHFSPLYAQQLFRNYQGCTRALYEI